TSNNSFPLGGASQASGYGYNISWGTWDPHGLLLGYLEQTPLANAANFAWAVGTPTAWNINSTVSLAIVNTFICPSDGLSPIPTANGMWSGETNNYLASMGTSTNYGSDGTGLFTQGGRCYGVQAITDGTSNTIAFAESLVGDNTIE